MWCVLNFSVCAWMCLCSWEVGERFIKGSSDFILSLGMKNLSLSYSIFIRFCSWSLNTLSRKRPYLAKLCHFLKRDWFRPESIVLKKFAKGTIFSHYNFFKGFSFYNFFWVIFNQFLNIFPIPKPIAWNPRIWGSGLCVVISIFRFKGYFKVFLRT